MIAGVHRPPPHRGDPMAASNDDGTVVSDDRFGFAKEMLDINSMLPGLNLHEPTALILDCNNLFARSKSNGFTPDYRKVADIFSSRCDLRRMEAYSALPRDTPEEQKKSNGWTTYMQQSGYAVFTKDIRTQINDYDQVVKKGNMDIDIACGALALSPGFTHIILGTCDGDFIPLVHELRKGSLRKVSILGVMGDNPRGISERLIRSANNFYDLARLREHIEYVPPFRAEQ